MLAVRPGLEPGLFWTKTRRVANYTIGQLLFTTDFAKATFVKIDYAETSRPSVRDRSSIKIYDF